MKRSIYGERSQPMRECVARAGGLEKLLVVPIDLAKKDFVAAVCLGTGEYVTRPFVVHNTPEGVEYLLSRLDGACRRHGCERQHVVVGGEDPAEYALNFLHRLRLSGVPFACVNAAQAAKLRTNSRAVSDSLALDGIAQALLQQRGRALADQDGLYAEMKAAARTRRRLVSDETAWKNRIHRSVEVLFPGFLSRQALGVDPFGEAILGLLAKDFCCERLRRLRPAQLAKRLGGHHLPKPDEVAARILALTGKVLPPPPERVAYESRRLASRVDMLRAVRSSLAQEENHLARCLVQSPGFYLTTIPGLGVTLAGHLVAEFGPPDRWPDVRHMASYVGIVSRQHATGGPGGHTVVGHLPADCNHVGKDYLLQAAHHVGTTGEHRLAKHFAKLETAGRHSLLGTARLLLRIARQMVVAQTPYLPDEFLRPGALRLQAWVEGYFEDLSVTLHRKWQGYDLSGLPDSSNRLAQWEKTSHELMTRILADRT